MQESRNILKPFGEWDIKLTNKLWSHLSGKKNIRGRILWVVILSWILAMFMTVVSDNLILLLPSWAESLAKLFNLIMLIACFIVFFFVFTHPIVRYFKALTDGLQSIASGDLSYRLPLSRLDELGTVAHNINQMAERLQIQQERERQLEKSKMELITYVSHDLRTPLTSIIGYLDLLKSHTYQNVTEQERYIDNAFNKTQQLKKLIDDLFEYTRLTDGHIRLTVQQVDMNSLLEQMITEFEPVAKEQGITVHTDLLPAPVMMDLDIEKIVRAIDNLLMNAMKFSDRPGTIQVSLDAGAASVTLSIENNGIAITPEQEEQLFERFYKIEPSRYDNQMPSGSGLGLSIAKHIVELHGGRIGLEHRNGHYRFFMDLMISAADRIPSHSDRSDLQ
jgi:signal transduction histidine kinase